MHYMPPKNGINLSPLPFGEGLGVGVISKYKNNCGVCY
jgi:hypothetical protein